MLQIFNENGKEILNTSEDIFQIIGSFTLSGSSRGDYPNQPYYNENIANRNVVLIPRGPKWRSTYLSLATDFTPYLFTVSSITSNSFLWHATSLHKTSSMWSTTIQGYDITVYVGVY